MKRALQFLFLLFAIPFLAKTQQLPRGSINRKQLVERHTVRVETADTLSSLSVGNGAFAFTTDITGLQTFPEVYSRGVPLGTQSEWGWHSFPNTQHYAFRDALKSYQLNGRDVLYAVQWSGGPPAHHQAADYFRQNLHRLQLGNIGFDIRLRNGAPARITDIRNITQELNMWTGAITSSFMVEGIPVTVSTFCHQQQDAIAVQVRSTLLTQGRLRIRIRLPYPTGTWADMGTHWNEEQKHQSVLTGLSKNCSVIRHTLDTTIYTITTTWTGAATIAAKAPHDYLLTPQHRDHFEFTCAFRSGSQAAPTPSYSETAANNRQQWAQFWKSGGAVDFSGSTDPRAAELERRIILSQYLTKIQCAGNNPPQETGLTYNSWYGKPHMEMHWWHGVHFALWGRTALLEKTLAWYAKAAGGARRIAERQGYRGLRWQKMTDNEGRESPSSVGAFLVWQQPHFIYFSELCYRAYPDIQTLNKYKDLVFATADFMASFPYYDTLQQRYILGKGIIAAQERFKAEETFNPTYELAYWRWGLQVAQRWRARLKLPREKNWDRVLQQLSALPVQGDKYLFTESAADSYTNPEYKTDHPSVFGALGMLPETAGVNKKIMQHTFDWIWNNWSWKDTWGWDFPMTAMTATRLGMPEKAIDALLMPIPTNTYLPNGHNYQDERLTLYLPGNGGLLAAIAMMCAGYDYNTRVLPGIPQNGQWMVKWEGLKKMP
ncbi:hypothetical protein LL912_05090 [Niabella sp. CC-SYL272]|uniref:hypothetical protein n=1 Tax=Niabella agricola TaxID=2891571 RepID=UPI001F1D75A4|nr:hypothetical protein [Niabella agricola]MCF3108144.1 hypothetical protein [Niabella agricola]